MLGTTQSSTPLVPTEQFGSTIQEPSLSTGEALDKFSLVVQKVCSISFLRREVACTLRNLTFFINIV